MTVESLLRRLVGLLLRRDGFIGRVCLHGFLVSKLFVGSSKTITGTLHCSPISHIRQTRYQASTHWPRIPFSLTKKSTGPSRLTKSDVFFNRLRASRTARGFLNQRDHLRTGASCTFFTRCSFSHDAMYNADKSFNDPGRYEIRGISQRPYFVHRRRMSVALSPLW